MSIKFLTTALLATTTQNSPWHQTGQFVATKGLGQCPIRNIDPCQNSNSLSGTEYKISSLSHDFFDLSHGTAVDGAWISPAYNCKNNSKPVNYHPPSPSPSPSPDPKWSDIFSMLLKYGTSIDYFAKYGTLFSVSLLGFCKKNDLKERVWTPLINQAHQYIQQVYSSIIYSPAIGRIGINTQKKLWIAIRPFFKIVLPLMFALNSFNIAGWIFYITYLFLLLIWQWGTTLATIGATIKGLHSLKAYSQRFNDQEQQIVDMNEQIQRLQSGEPGREEAEVESQIHALQEALTQARNQLAQREPQEEQTPFTIWKNRAITAWNVFNIITGLAPTLIATVAVPVVITLAITTSLFAFMCIVKITIFLSIKLPYTLVKRTITWTAFPKKPLPLPQPPKVLLSSGG